MLDNYMCTCDFIIVFCFTCIKVWVWVPG